MSITPEAPIPRCPSTDSHLLPEYPGRVGGCPSPLRWEKGRVEGVWVTPIGRKDTLSPTGVKEDQWGWGVRVEGRCFVYGTPRETRFGGESVHLIDSGSFRSRKSLSPYFGVVWSPDRLWSRDWWGLVPDHPTSGPRLHPLLTPRSVFWGPVSGGPGRDGWRDDPPPPRKTSVNPFPRVTGTNPLEKGLVLT